jgi:esterase/lipase
MQELFKVEDFKEFLNNYNDPNFRSLFEEFTSTAKNAEEKSVFIKEMRKLQRETLKVEVSPLGESNLQIEKKQNKYKDVVYFHGFCVQTNATVYRDYGTISKPTFVNICQSDQIKMAVTKKNCTHGKGHSHHHHEKLPENIKDVPNFWKIPHSPAVREKAENSDHRIYTISFGTQTLVRARKDFPFKQTLIKTAFEVIEEEHDEVLSAEYVILDIAFKEGYPVQEPIDQPNNIFVQEKEDEINQKSNQEIKQEGINREKENAIDQKSNQVIKQEIKQERVDPEKNFNVEQIFSFDKRDFIWNELRKQENLQVISKFKIPFIKLHFSFFSISQTLLFPSFSATQTNEQAMILFEEPLDVNSLVGPFFIPLDESKPTVHLLSGQFKSLKDDLLHEFLFQFDQKIDSINTVITQEKKLLIILKKNVPCIWLHLNN